MQSRSHINENIHHQDTISLYGNIMTADDFRKGMVYISNGKIASVEFGENINRGHTICLDDLYIVPGFIDLHMHGIHYDLVDHGSEALEKISNNLLQYGITGFVPTVYPKPAAEHIAFIKEIAGINPQGASVLGFHLEGPFLKLTGSLSQSAISNVADAQRAQALIEACLPYKAIFSISPEIEGIADIIPLMTTYNTPVYMTHTAATVAEAQAAIAAGAKHATHFYDVFPCPPVTEPGVRPCGIVEVILADKDVSVDFILDGVHVDPVAVKMAMACKENGRGKVCLITDSNVGAGLEPGRFDFGESGEIYFEYKGAPARMTKDNGLAGSGLTMDQAVRNAMKFLDIPLHKAITMVSTNPAHVLNIAGHKGLIAEGYDADIVVIDENVNVQQAWVNGSLLFDQIKIKQEATV